MGEPAAATRASPQTTTRSRPQWSPHSRGVGTSSPVTLSPEGEALLALAGEVEAWLEEAGPEGLPDGIFDLRNALTDEEDLNRR
jgi:hypothetical protein